MSAGILVPMFTLTAQGDFDLFGPISRPS